MNVESGKKSAPFRLVSMLDNASANVEGPRMVTRDQY